MEVQGCDITPDLQGVVHEGSNSVSAQQGRILGEGPHPGGRMGDEDIKYRQEREKKKNGEEEKWDIGQATGKERDEMADEDLTDE